jgi:hypothetical protein
VVEDGIYVYGRPQTSVEQINNTTNTITYLHHDQQGSTRLLTSTTGAKEATFTYSPYGELTGSTGTATAPLGYDSQYTSSDTGLITATYDVAGKMLSEGLPDKLTANYTYNQTGEATGLEYKKSVDCGSSCTWFDDTVVPSIHGETMQQSSTLSEEPNYTYDAAGRLVSVQETPAGKGCTTRIYAYDEDNNRTSLTTRAPIAENKCASEGGTVENHTYDSADRLNDAGTSYETFDNITALSAADAGGHELASTYYVDGQLATQAQNGEKIEYKLDPEGRTRETISSGNTASTTISHYAAPGDALTLTTESTEKWSRSIPGIGGELIARQTNGGVPLLELQDLQGNIVAEAADNETETKLLSTYNSTEFGVPTTSNPPKYSWLGADGVSSELPSGVISQGGSSYVPFIGRPLQPTASVLPLPVIEIYGHWHCGETVTLFVVQIALLIENPETGKWEDTGESYENPYSDVNGDSNEDPPKSDFHCGPEHADYDAWVFGRQYDGSDHARWWGWGREAEIRTSCHGGVSTP